MWYFFISCIENGGMYSMNYIFSVQFTEEQEAVFAAAGDIKINAVAGSGKTTVLVEFARRQRAGARILYLAFNRSVRLSAQQRFTEQNLTNVDVQTAHSLAFRRIALPNNYTITKGYKIPDIAKILDVRPIGRDPHSSYIIAGHILKFAALFCNSAKSQIRDLDYRTIVTDEVAAKTVGRYYDAIEKGTRQFLAKMDRKEIDATHDFYLKKYQLSRPVLNYDLIMFDEGQDASPVMLDVFLAQKARKVIVGDRFQQIYGWRRAINALNRIDFTEYSLTASFRFNEHIAGLAMECLRWKELLGENVGIRIRGLGRNKKIKTTATLARTNLALLKRAIDTVQHERSVKTVYFEGNINSYTYAADGASIYDVLNLYLDKRDCIRDPLIGAMKSFEDLGEYAEKSEDVELKMLMDIVAAYETTDSGPAQEVNGHAREGRPAGKGRYDLLDAPSLQGHGIRLGHHGRGFHDRRTDKEAFGKGERRAPRPRKNLRGDQCILCRNNEVEEFPGISRCHVSRRGQAVVSE